MMKTADGLYVNIHEAALVDYPAMNLGVDKKTFGLTAHLVPDARRQQGLPAERRPTRPGARSW